MYIKRRRGRRKVKKRIHSNTCASLVAQLVKNPPTMQETQVRCLDGEDPLEKEMATHSSILAQKISWTEKPGRLQSMGSPRVRHDLSTKPSPFKHLISLTVQQPPQKSYQFFLASFFGGFPDSSVGKESICKSGDPGSILSREDPLKKGRLATPAFSGFPGGSAGKESIGNVGDLGSITGLVKIP